MMTKINFSFLTASSLGLAVFICVEIGLAQVNKQITSVKDSIELARRMALRGERYAAQAFLIEKLGNPKVLPPEKLKLRKALNQLSNQFFGDKAQSVFELGESHFFAKRYVEAFARYKEATELEPNNTLSRAAMVRTLIAQGDCRRAMEYAEQSLQQQPYDDGLLVMSLRAQVCEKMNVDQLRVWREKALSLEKSHPLEVAWLRLLASDASDLKEKRELTRFATEQQNFPEPRYYLFLLATEVDEKQKNGLEYLRLCNKNDQLIRRKYVFEPQLCSQTKIIEDYMAKGEVEQ